MDQLLEVFHVLNHRNPGGRVMFSVSPADFVGQLLDFFMGLDGCRWMNFRFSVSRPPRAGETIWDLGVVLWNGNGVQGIKCRACGL